MTADRAAPQKGIARIVTAALVIAMVTGGVALHALGWRLPAPRPPVSLSWWMLVVAFAIADVFVIPLRIGRDKLVVSLSEIPLALGLAAASPSGFVVGRMLGAGLAQGLARRSRGGRIGFNLALAYLEASGSLFLYRTLLDGASPVSSDGLIAAAATLALVALMSSTVVALAIRVNRNSSNDDGAMAPAVMTSLALSTVGVVVSIGGLVLFWNDPAWLVAIVLASSAVFGVLRWYAALTRRYEDLEAVYAFTSAIDAAADTDALVETTLNEVRSLFEVSFGEVVLSRGVGSTATSLGATGEVKRRPAPPAIVEAIVGGAGTSVSTLADAPAAIRDHYRSRGVEEGMVAELHGGAGTAALIVVGNPATGNPRFGRDELRLFDALAKQTRASFDRGRLVDRLRREVGQKEHQALHDALTGLPNRLHFTIVVEDALRAARETQSRVAVLLIDLDRFKEINDTLGHQRGDVLLQEMALRLSETVGGEDHMARLGGDEFGVVLRSVGGVAEAADWARRIGSTLQRPFLNEGLSIQVTGSIGIALAPDHGSDGPTLLRRADVAMYEAKASGSSFEVYDPQRDRYSTRRLALAGELRDAIEAGSLALHYQPKVRIADGTVVGVEALSRWVHPRHGVIPPDEFIPLAERTGLIVPLTERVLGIAFRDIGRLRSEGHRLSVAVNIASTSLTDLDFPDLIARLIAEHDADPLGVTLEVTETTMMTDSARTRLVLAALDEIGVSLSIDDFGTGYSSLSYLSNLPVDEVKIDRSFVMDMAVDERLSKIVTSTTGLVHSLGLKVVAEGVENRGTWELLRQAGCDIGQGFYVARPMGFTDLGAWLEAGSPFQGDSTARTSHPRAMGD